MLMLDYLILVYYFTLPYSHTSILVVFLMFFMLTDVMKMETETQGGRGRNIWLNMEIDLMAIFWKRRVRSTSYVLTDDKILFLAQVVAILRSRSVS